MSTTQSAWAMVSRSCFDDDQRIAEIPQPDQGFDQPAVVALMQADGRLVEHIEHTDQT